MFEINGIELPPVKISSNRSTRYSDRRVNHQQADFDVSFRAHGLQIVPDTWVRRSQWIVETQLPSISAGVFHCSVSRGRVFNFLATRSS